MLKLKRNGGDPSIEDKRMPGLYFDELSVGQVFKHPIRRTLTEALTSGSRVSRTIPHTCNWMSNTVRNIPNSGTGSSIKKRIGGAMQAQWPANEASK